LIYRNLYPTLIQVSYLGVILVITLFIYIFFRERFKLDSLNLRNLIYFYLVILTLFLLTTAVGFWEFGTIDVLGRILLSSSLS